MFAQSGAVRRLYFVFSSTLSPFSTHLKLYSSRLRCFWYPGTAGLIFGVLSLRLSGVELHRGLGEGGRARNLAFRENL